MYKVDEKIIELGDQQDKHSGNEILNYPSFLQARKYSYSSKAALPTFGNFDYVN